MEKVPCLTLKVQVETVEFELFQKFNRIVHELLPGRLIFEHFGHLGNAESEIEKIVPVVS